MFKQASGRRSEFGQGLYDLPVLALPIGLESQGMARIHIGVLHLPDTDLGLAVFCGFFPRIAGLRKGKTQSDNKTESRCTAGGMPVVFRGRELCGFAQ